MYTYLVCTTLFVCCLYVVMDNTCFGATDEKLSDTWYMQLDVLKEIMLN